MLTVPFYQFRHLTFQEYLAAVAAVENYTLTTGDTKNLLTALQDNLITDEWKEVVPMAAVLARSQAAPLIEALVNIAEDEAAKFENGNPRRLTLSTESRLPPATARLAQSMVEEAIFDREPLAKAVRFVALLADGCKTNDNWQLLSRGPYGPDLRSAALDIFLAEKCHRRSLARNAVGILEAQAESSEFWSNSANEDIITARLQEIETAHFIRTILSIGGGFWLYRETCFAARSEQIYNILESALFDSRECVQLAASWTWGFWRHLQPYIKMKAPRPSDAVISQLISFTFSDNADFREVGNMTLPLLTGIARNDVKLAIKKSHKENLLKIITNSNDEKESTSRKKAIARISFILDGVASDEQIRKFIVKNSLIERFDDDLDDIALALKLLTEKTRPQRRSKAAPSN